MTYETKDSGVRQQYASGMVRDAEEGKARFDLLFPLNVPYARQMLTRFADLMARGAEKYDERNWEKARGAEELARYRSSAMRHLVQWESGEEDEDHAAAVMFNLLAAETVKYRMEERKDIDSAYPEELPEEGEINWSGEPCRIDCADCWEPDCECFDQPDCPYHNKTKEVPWSDEADIAPYTCSVEIPHRCRAHPQGLVEERCRWHGLVLDKEGQCHWYDSDAYREQQKAKWEPC